MGRKAWVWWVLFGTILAFCLLPLIYVVGLR